MSANVGGDSSLSQHDESPRPTETAAKSSPPTTGSASTGARQNGAPTNSKAATGANDGCVVYDVEHLATFSTTGSHEANNGSGPLAQANAGGASNGTAKPAGGAKQQPSSTSSSSSSSSASSLEHTNSQSPTTRRTTPKVALQRLSELEKQSGIWTQRMQIKLRNDFMLIVDCETNSVVEKFDRDCVTKPEAFNEYNDIYNNIVVFTINQRQQQDHHKASEHLEGDKSSKDASKEANGELHIFQCVSHKAQQLVTQIEAWKSSSPTMDMSKARTVKNQSAPAENDHEQTTVASAESARAKQIASTNGKPTTDHTQAAKKQDRPVVTVASGGSAGENVPIVNVNVKETVQVFNQIAALREKGKPSSPTSSSRPLSDASAASSRATPPSAAANPARLSGPPNMGGSSGAPESIRSSLSPGGQLSKQRSIRATLAPKFVSGNQDKSAPSIEQAHSASTNSSSTVSSVSSAEAKGNSYQSANQSQSRHSSGAAIASNGHHAAPAGRPTSGQHQPSAKQAPAPGHSHSHHHHHHKSSSSSHKSSRGQQAAAHRGQSDSSRPHASSVQSQIDQVSTNESYVSVLNHCFDDIEKFIIQVQQTVSAIRELEAKRKLMKRANQTNGAGLVSKYAPGKGAVGPIQPPLTSAELAMLSARARGPSEDDYFEILSKFKLAFNLLAKLKGCIHEPNAPELVHFLFTPLAIIIEAARNATPPIDPTLVGVPYLNQDALDLLSNCCTSKESDMWMSLGPNWTQTIDPALLNASRLPTSFQPIFSDGWAPVICELELIGLVAPRSSANSTPIDCLLPTEIDDVSQHDHRMRHKSSGYMDGPDDCGYQPANLGKVRSDGPRAHGSARDIRRRDGSPSPPIGRQHDHHGESMAQPYLDSVSYRYSHEVPIDGVCRDESALASYRHSDYSARSSRSNSTQNKAARKLKPNSARFHRQDYPAQLDYELDPHYPAMHLQRGPDKELVDHDDRMHSDGYTQLNNRYYDDHLPRGPPGPSRRVQRNEREHTRYQHGDRLKNHDAIYNPHPIIPPYEGETLSDIDHEAMLLDLGPAQTEWFYELQSRGALIVRVLFTREANNDKELSVRRGEVLEVLDDTRKWWRARNSDLQIAHVPHTIVAVMHGYQTLDELLINSPADHSNAEASKMDPTQYSRRELQQSNYSQWHGRDEKTSSKAAGAFRYF